tara:strand:+ start:21 stop:650 length:630 start_codon:yes stop_codon:yes gene_type:complete
MIEADVLHNIIEDIKKAPAVEIHKKKYTTVATRLEIFRKHTGFKYGINTDIVTYGSQPGEKIVIKATISTDQGFVLASGTAEEIIGSGNINKTSALENCESSAWGRALGSLGIHGGEFPSYDEMEIAKGKEDKLEDNPKPEGDPEDKLAAAEKYVEQQIKAIQTMNQNALTVWTQHESDNLKSLADLNKNLHTKLFNAYKERKQNAVSA